MVRKSVYLKCGGFLSLVTTNEEKSAETLMSEEVPVMEMERRVNNQ